MRAASDQRPIIARIPEKEEEANFKRQWILIIAPRFVAIQPDITRATNDRLQLKAAEWVTVVN